MSNKYCYLPNSTIDNKVEEKIKQSKGINVNSQYLAIIRGMYDESKATEDNDYSIIDDTSLSDEEKVNELYKFYQEKEAQDKKFNKNDGSNISAAYNQLMSTFNTVDFEDRVSFIAHEISDIVTKLELNDKLKPYRIDRINFFTGVTIPGLPKIDQMFLCESVFLSMLKKREDFINKYNEADKAGIKEDKEKFIKLAKQYNEIIVNWKALMTFVRIKLRDMEGVKLNNYGNFAEVNEEDSFDVNDLVNKIDLAEATRESWQEYNDQRAAFGSIGIQVRRTLSFIPLSTIDDYGTHPSKDSMDQPRYVDPVKAHQQLLDVLRGMVSSKDMMSKLEKAKASYPWIEDVIEKLKNNNLLKTQFYVDFKKNFQKYSDLEIKTEKGRTTFKTRILNRIGDKSLSRIFTNIKKGVQLNSSLSTYDEEGKIIHENLSSLRSSILSKRSIEGSSKGAYKVESSKNRLTDSITDYIYARRNADGTLLDKDFLSDIQGWLASMGIKATSETLLALSDFSNRKKFNELVKYIYNLATYGLHDDQSALKGKDYIEFLRENNSYSENIKKIHALLDVYDESIKADSRAIRKDKKGNSVTFFSNVNPCYMGDKFEEFQHFFNTNDHKGLKNHIEANYLSSSYFYTEKDGKKVILHKWLRELYEACDGKTDLRKFSNIFDFSRFLGTPDLDFEDFTSKQHAVSMIHEFFSDIDISGKAKDTALYPIFILGDSGVAKYYRQKTYDRETLLNEFYNVYIQEVKRMHSSVSVNEALEKSGYEKIENYDRQEFVFLPFLNDKENLSKIMKDGNYIMDAELIKGIIDENIQRQFQEFKDELTKVGVFEKVEGKDDYKYFPNISKWAQLSNFKTSQEAPQKNAPMEQQLSYAMDKALMNMFYNTKFSIIEQFQLMTIDVSFYKNVKDLQKRYKEIHAPGTSVDIYAKDANNNYYNPIVNGVPSLESCIYFEDLEVSAPDDFIQVASNLFGKTKPSIVQKYRENTLTDGQGYRGLTSYRKVLGMAGQWTQEMERVYADIMYYRSKVKASKDYANSDKGKALFKRIVESAVIFKPLKPYMFTHERLKINVATVDENGQPAQVKDTVLIPVQHKYAEAVLIPELLPVGSKLRDLAEYMEDNNIDMVGSTKICKVGCFGQAKINNLEQYDKDIIESTGKKAEEITNTDRLHYALSKAYVHKLSYTDYRIQTNVPDHIYQSRLVGTQLRKLIMAHLDFYKDYSSYISDAPIREDGVQGVALYQNGELNQLVGKNLLALYNGLIVANIMDSFQQFKSIVKDPSAISSRLIQGIINNNREKLDNILSYALNDKGNFNIPLFEGGLEHDSAAALLSLFKKLVNKQTINGGSAVQVSAMGIKDYSEDGGLQYVVDPDNKDNILYAECEIPWNLNITDNNGNLIPLKFDDYCISDPTSPEYGTLKLGKEIDASHPKYKEYLSFKDKEGKVHMPKIEEDFPGILDIVAYRIPTERDYSMINVKVVRFSQKVMGGTIKVPAPGTTIAGFDFDIDKLYFMRKEFSYKLSHDLIEKVWKDIYNNRFGDSNGILRALIETRDDKSKKSQLEEGLMTYLFDIFEDQPYNALDPNSKEINKEISKKNSERVAKKDRLYKWWGDALKAGKLPQGTPSTPEEFFGKFFKDHLKSYYSKLSFDSYDYNKTPINNSRVARNNLFLHIIRQRLMDKETLQERLTPGGFANSSDAARILREITFNYNDESLFAIDKVTGDAKIIEESMAKRIKEKSSDPEPNYDPTDPMTIIRYNQQNQVAGKLIGIFANQNTNHALASLLESFTIGEGYKIEFAGHTAAEGYGVDLLHAPEGVDVSLNMAEFLAASVDAVKDPVLNFLNFNTLTADAGAVLARTGYSPLEIGLLLNQPIIKQLCEQSFNDNARLEDTISAFKLKYANNNFDVSAGDEGYSTKEALIGQIIAYNKDNKVMEDENFIRKQLQVLNLFEKIQTVANEVSNFVTATKFTAANAVSSNFGDMFAQQMKVDNYVKNIKASQEPILNMIVYRDSGETIVDSPINNDEENIKNLDNPQEYLNRFMNNPMAYEQAEYDANRAAINILMKYYPYLQPMYTEVRDYMRNLQKYNYLKGDVINSIHRDFMLYYLSRKNSLFNGDKEVGEEGKSMRVRDYYLQDFPGILFDALENCPRLKQIPLLNAIQFDSNLETGKIELRLAAVGGLEQGTKNVLIENWSYLNETVASIIKDDPNLEDKVKKGLLEDISNLAQDLFLYNFHQYGFEFNTKSFMSLAPTRVKEMIKAELDRDHEEEDLGESYPDFLQDLLDDDSYRILDVSEFAKLYIVNNPNSPFVQHIYNKDQEKLISSLARQGLGLGNEFTISSQSIKDKNLRLENGKQATVDDFSFIASAVYKNEEIDHYKFAPAIYIKGNLYLAAGTGDNFFESSREFEMKYVKVPEIPKGTKNYSSDALNGKPTSAESGNIFPQGNSSINDVTITSPLKDNKDSILKDTINTLKEKEKENNDEFDPIQAAMADVLDVARETTREKDIKDLSNQIDTDNIDTYDSEGDQTKICNPKK